MLFSQNLFFFFLLERIYCAIFAEIFRNVYRQKKNEREREREMVKKYKEKAETLDSGQVTRSGFARELLKESGNSLRGRAVSVWSAIDVRYSERKAYKHVSGKAQGNSILFTVRPCQFPSVMFRRGGVMQTDNNTPPPSKTRFGNTWSYTACTPQLVRLNIFHLKHARGRTDSLSFSLETFFQHGGGTESPPPRKRIAS